MFFLNSEKMTSKIPQTILQTWKTHEVPAKWSSSPISIQKHMPSWEYILMDDNENRTYVARHFPDFLPYYDAFEYPIQRADAIRYCWMAIHGGVYIDLDMELQKPLDDFLTNYAGVYLVNSSNIGSSLTNSFMASGPGHPLWYEVIEEMKKPLPWWCIGKHWKVMNSTGPMMLDRVVKRSNHVYVTLPSKAILPCSVCDHVCDAPESYILPLEGQSWTGWDTQVYNFGLCKWKGILILIGIFVVLFLLYLLYRAYRKK